MRSTATKLTRACAGVAVLAAVCAASAQDPPTELTLEERIAALESRVAGLETRFELRDTLAGGAGGGSAAAAARIVQLERSLELLAADLERVERQADTALREALQARRDAIAAQQVARDAARMR